MRSSPGKQPLLKTGRNSFAELFACAGKRINNEFAVPNDQEFDVVDGNMIDSVADLGR